MTRAWHRWLFAALAAGSLASAACNKPTPETCRKALTNMQRLMGTDNLLKPADFEGEVRSCRGGSTREAVECATKATSIEQLHACDFYKVPGGDNSKPDKPADKPPTMPITPTPTAAPTTPPAPTTGAPTTPSTGAPTTPSTGAPTTPSDAAAAPTATTPATTDKRSATP